MSDIPSAWLRRKITLAPLLAVLLMAVAWTGRQLFRHYLKVVGGPGHELDLVWALTFAAFLWHVTLSWWEGPFTTTEEQQEQLARARVTLNVPVFNEDPAALRTALRSILQQTRPVQRVQVVNDGSSRNLEELMAVRQWWLQQSHSHSSRLEWIDVPNAGKRHAQAITFRDDDADIFATMDSDTVLDARCVEEGLKPFARANITSVASVILAYNNRKWFVRLADTWILAFQLTVRGAMSKLGCVLVNSGNFAMYRAAVVRDALPGYENEFFRGRPVQFSDDTLLTLFAKLRGRTVQQPTSFAFTVLPSTVSHHLRQQLRWIRGATIRSMWHFRYLPLRGLAYWEHLIAWVNFVLISAALVVILVVDPAFTHSGIDLALVILAVLSCFTVNLKYLTIARSDQGLGFQICTLLLAPVMALWTLCVLRPLRIFAIATCYRTEWGTRAKVEVEL